MWTSHQCCARRSISADVLCPYFSISSSVDRNTEKKSLHFFCSMVVAQPHDCNIGQTGGCDNLVQFGHEYRETKCLSLIVQHSLLVLVDTYRWAEQKVVLSMNCSTSAKLFLNKAGIDLPSGIEEDAHYLCSDECTFCLPIWRACAYLPPPLWCNSPC